MSNPLFLPTPSQEGVKTFQKLVQARFGQNLGDEQARDLASRYLLIYSIGTTPVDKIALLTTMKGDKP